MKDNVFSEEARKVIREAGIGDSLRCALFFLRHAALCMPISDLEESFWSYIRGIESSLDALGDEGRAKGEFESVVRDLLLIRGETG